MPPSTTTHSRHPPRPSPPGSAAGPPTSIDDSRLGLAPQDVEFLRRHQQLAHANVRSPAGSQASSQGRLLLDPGSLHLLSRHFDHVMAAIQQRMDQLSDAMDRAMEAQSSRTSTALQTADREIARYHAIMKQIDELDHELEKIQSIKGLVDRFRQRVADLERRIG